MFQMSDHSKARAAQRRLTLEELEYVHQYGKRYFCEGARVYYLREKDLPPGDRRRSWGNLVGTAVVVTLDLRVVITTWRNRKAGLKFLRRRGDRRGGRGSASPWEKDLLDDTFLLDARLEEEGAEAAALLNFPGDLSGDWDE